MLISLSTHYLTAEVQGQGQSKERGVSGRSWATSTTEGREEGRPSVHGGSRGRMNNTLPSLSLSLSLSLSPSLW